MVCDPGPDALAPGYLMSRLQRDEFMRVGRPLCQQGTFPPCVRVSIAERPQALDQCDREAHAILSR